MCVCVLLVVVVVVVAVLVHQRVCVGKKEKVSKQAVSVGVCNPSQRPSGLFVGLGNLVPETRGWCVRTPPRSSQITDRYQGDPLPSHAYWNDRGEILRSMWDARERRRSAGPHPPIKNESVGIEDDQIPS